MKILKIVGHPLVGKVVSQLIAKPALGLAVGALGIGGTLLVSFKIAAITTLVFGILAKFIFLPLMIIGGGAYLYQRYIKRPN